MMAMVKVLGRSLVKWVITPAIGSVVALVIGARVTSFFVGPENYKVYVIGKLGDEDELKTLFDAIPDGLVANLTIDKKPLKIEKRDDKGDPHYAEQVAQEISRRGDTLLVIGHTLSTQTKTALPYYLGEARQSAKPPIPVILTTETNPDLLPRQVSEGSCPTAMRLSPTDEMQAEKAAKFAVSRATNFWVVNDTDNSVYSSYLAREFTSQVNRLNKRVILPSTNQSVPSIDALKALKIDGVFFAGEWADALILIRQVRALAAAGAFPSAHGPMVMLSDGSVDKALLQKGGKEVNNIFLTHPLKASEYNDKNKAYAQYGKSAYTLVQKLIEQANNKFGDIRRNQAWLTYWVRQVLNMHRVSDARAVLDEVIQKLVTQENGLNSLTDCKYHRNEAGVESTSGFNVWQIVAGKFTDVE
jgi:branched-chain amino acid transport system substrate-binding protein